MSKPTIQDYVQAAYLHGLSTENLDTGELEPPRDISETDWITEAIEAQITAKLNQFELDIAANYAAQLVGYKKEITTLRARIKELEGNDNG
jgi:hypothetical protein